MAFWDDAKKKMMQAIKPKQQQQGQQGFSSNRADGGFSGYVPKMKRPEAEQGQNGPRPGGVTGFANMMPEGVDPSMMQQFQPVGGQTGAVPPQQAMPQQGMPQQAPFGRTGYQPPMGAAQPMGGQVPPRPQAQFQGQLFQQPMQQPQRGFTARQEAASRHQAQPQGGFPQGSMPPQPSAAPSEPQAFAFSGGDSYMVDGNAYRMILRVAQITGVPSCFRVIEFMYNNEAVIVNAEQVTDLVEADRCMDLIFGAACAMKQRLMRVSGKQIYVITPPQVYVAPFDSLRRAGMEDIERRWPGAMQSSMQAQPMVNNIQSMQPMGAQTMHQQSRQDDFVGGFGRRAARNAMHANGYTDYGGFSTKSR